MKETAKNQVTAPDSARGLGRTILALAVPALGALIAEPLFLLADMAIIGHLGINELAGAGLGTTVLQTAVGLMVFLAYSTTPAVARAIGAGDMGKAMAAGRDGIWLAVVLGVVLALAGFFGAPMLAAAMGAEGEVRGFAVDYIQYSTFGIPAMLLVLAATGVLRGMQDTRTPLYVAGVGFAANIALNFILVYPLGMSVAGAALGTSIAQWGMAAVYLWMLVPRIRKSGQSLAPHPRGVLGTGQVGSWLMLRTLSLRLALLATVWVATGQGALTLAAHQLVFTIFTFMAFALDALAIAAQALIGKELGAGNAGRTNLLTKTMCRWGVYFGLATGAVLALIAPFVGALFTTDDSVRQATMVGVWILAASQPVCGLVFVLDGVLIGAGDARYLAVAGMINLAAYLPMLFFVTLFEHPGVSAVAWIWVAFGLGFMLARAATLSWRVRNGKWMRLGA
ncbi:MATE family efflux transporter [Arthrobacter sp. AQ5-05]|uniref:MATE family efflux transporter n=1 Tax=Arthrobacter sp. AQ5-05 TaxID=2184581 RepID=UPI000DCE00D8|nr:MATE family efflux transporter [Arthrobacter sp. AQ5-05]RAX48116.1 MATE family efflux transporter [Arthrobacter sp. AQ5-05]